MSLDTKSAELNLPDALRSVSHDPGVLLGGADLHPNRLLLPWERQSLLQAAVSGRLQLLLRCNQTVGELAGFKHSSFFFFFSPKKLSSLSAFGNYGEL